jgi:hypothetical protein
MRRRSVGHRPVLNVLKAQASGDALLWPYLKLKPPAMPLAQLKAQAAGDAFCPTYSSSCRRYLLPYLKPKPPAMPFLALLKAQAVGDAFFGLA